MGLPCFPPPQRADWGGELILHRLWEAPSPLVVHREAVVLSPSSPGNLKEPQCSHQHVFTRQDPHFLFRAHSHTPFCILTRLLLFICVCYYMVHTDMFVWLHWCVHTHWEEKRMSIVNLLKGERDPRCFLLARPLWRKDVNSWCPRRERLLREFHILQWHNQHLKSILTAIGLESDVS